MQTVTPEGNTEMDSVVLELCQTTLTVIVSIRIRDMAWLQGVHCTEMPCYSYSAFACPTFWSNSSTGICAKASCGGQGPSINKATLFALLHPFDLLYNYVHKRTRWTLVMLHYQYGSAVVPEFVSWDMLTISCHHHLTPKIRICKLNI